MLHNSEELRSYHRPHDRCPWGCAAHSLCCHRRGPVPVPWRVVFSLPHSSVAGVLGAFGLISGVGGCNLVARHLVGQITTEPFDGALRNQSQVEVNYITQIISKHCITQKSPYRMEISDCFGGGSAVYHSDCSVFEPVFSCLHISLSKIGEGNLNRPWKQMRRTQEGSTSCESAVYRVEN